MKSTEASPAALSLVPEVYFNFTSAPPVMHFRQAPDSASGFSLAKHDLLRSDIQASIKKNAIKHAPSSVGFYALLFLVPKEEW